MKQPLGMLPPIRSAYPDSADPPPMPPKKGNRRKAPPPPSDDGDDDDLHSYHPSQHSYVPSPERVDDHMDEDPYADDLYSVDPGVKRPPSAPPSEHFVDPPDVTISSGVAMKGELRRDLRRAVAAGLGLGLRRRRLRALRRRRRRGPQIRLDGRAMRRHALPQRRERVPLRRRRRWGRLGGRHGREEAGGGVACVDGDARARGRRAGERRGRARAPRTHSLKEVLPAHPTTADATTTTVEGPTTTGAAAPPLFFHAPFNKGRINKKVLVKKKRAPAQCCDEGKDPPDGAPAADERVGEGRAAPARWGGR